MNRIWLHTAKRSLYAAGIGLSFLLVLIASPKSAVAGADQWIEQVVMTSPTLSIDDVSELEGNSGTTDFVFTVTLSKPTSLPVTVFFITKDGTAQGGGPGDPNPPADYQTVSGSITIPANEVSATITVRVKGDPFVEEPETFFVNLSTGDQGQGLIRNDDGRPSGVGDELVADFALGQVMPTPSRGVARFEFALPRESKIRLTVLDLLGREVAVLAEGSYRAGRHQGVWNGRIGDQAAPAGVYFLRYHTPQRNFVRRIVLAR